MLVLGLETSCDETAAAVVDESYAVHSNIIFSQQDHAQYGGVVPELASRAHIRTVVPVIRQALATAGIGWEDVDGVAATRGPGLVGSLIVGLSLAKGVALARNKPLVGVHHLEAHVFSNLIATQVEAPFLTLLVSGGHTELILVRTLGSYEVLGRTRDDAAGEAFDKVAKLLGLLPEEGAVAGGRLIDIAYGREDATREEIVAAAKTAQIHDEIMELPEGYDTVIGERGVSLSGGQRQRLSIARTLALDPPILVLDDSTSSVDAGTESRIQEAMDEVIRGRTAFIIAHRLSSIRRAELVIVMRDGKIGEMGTPDELIASGGLFAHVAELQYAAGLNGTAVPSRPQAVPAGGAAL